MNLDYRKGDINFDDLNSSREYDPSTAFYQSQLANMLTVSTLAKHWKDDNISVNAVWETRLDCKIPTCPYSRCIQGSVLQISSDTWV